MTKKEKDYEKYNVNLIIEVFTSKIKNTDKHKRNSYDSIILKTFKFKSGHRNLTEVDLNELYPHKIVDIVEKFSEILAQKTAKTIVKQMHWITLVHNNVKVNDVDSFTFDMNFRGVIIEDKTPELWNKNMMLYSYSFASPLDVFSKTFGTKQAFKRLNIARQIILRGQKGKTYSLDKTPALKGFVCNGNTNSIIL